MKVLLFMYLLYFFNCEVSGFKEVASASASLSETVHTVKEAFEIKKEIDEIRGKRKNNGNKRVRRYSTLSNQDASSTINKVTTGIGAVLKTYLYQPIAHGNFLETTIRGYNMFNMDEGKFVFGTLNGELNQSFSSMFKNRQLRTGDIISCRIPTDRMAEHYMMIINNKIAEVGVVGGKSTHDGVITIDSYRKSSYMNSTECLYHENRLISRAEQIDERNGNDNEADLRYNQILERFACTISGNNTGHFNYDVMYCNCQDLVLYWAYGYMESNCLPLFFNGCSKYLTSTLFQISRYVDESGHLQKMANERERAILNNPGFA